MMFLSTMMSCTQSPLSLSSNPSNRMTTWLSNRRRSFRNIMCMFLFLIVAISSIQMVTSYSSNNYLVPLITRNNHLSTPQRLSSRNNIITTRQSPVLLKGSIRQKSIALGVGFGGGGMMKKSSGSAGGFKASGFG
ncbi:hypothetical protein ACHAWC_000304, partial [Mediolabrus comicus]